MSKEWPEDEKALPEDYEQDEQDDSYDGEMARQAVGRLFEEDEPPEDGFFVSGFGKTHTEEPVEGRERGRSRDLNPSPRPAVKLNASAARSPSRSRSISTREDEGLSDDGFSAFRPRSRERETAAPKNPAPSRPAYTRPERTARQVRPYQDTYAEDPISPLRWVMAAIIIAVLALMAFLVFRITVLNGRLSEANAKLNDSTNGITEISQIRLENESLRSQLTEKDELIENLQAQLSQGSRHDTAVADPPPSAAVINGTSHPDETPATPPPVEEPKFPARYTVVSGDSLSKIAKLFYGSGSQANIKKIQEANNLASPNNIQIGQELIIPE